MPAMVRFRAGRLSLVGVVLLLWRAAATLAEEATTNAWRDLEPGLELAAFPAPQKSVVGDSLIHVLRIDPARFELRLVNASAPGQGAPLSAREWCTRHGLVAAINASMYQTDHKTSISLMTSRAHTNNARVTKQQAVLAFDRLDESVPPVQIIDRQQQDFDALRGHYGTLVQSIRMVSPTGENVWQAQSARWSTAAVGIDRQGRVLFIHVRSLYTTHDVINALLALPLELRNAMYVEGGPEAQLFVRTNAGEKELLGIYDNGLVDPDSAPIAWPIPNVIGVARRTGG